MSARCAHSHVGARAYREQQSRIRQHYEVSNIASNRETKDTLYKLPGKQLRTYATQRRRVEQQIDRNYKCATPSRLTSHVVSCSSSRCDKVAVDAYTTTNDDIISSSLFKIVARTAEVKRKTVRVSLASSSSSSSSSISHHNTKKYGNAIRAVTIKTRTGLTHNSKRHHYRHLVKAKAAAEAEEGSTLKTLAEEWKLPFYFTLWYGFNIIFNIYNKSTLNVFPYPYFLSTIQLAFGVLFMAGLWASKLQALPKVDRGLFVPLAAVSLFHTIGHVSSCVSFSKMAVSFTHVIKSAEPVFSVLLSSVFFRETFSIFIWMSLIPIVVGCSCAAMKEVSFNISGFNGAMLSNFAFVFRNILSKKYMIKYKDSIDGINLYGLISIMSLGYMIPLALFMEGPAIWKEGIASASSAIGAVKLWQLIVIGGITYHLYNQTSYMALTGISAVTFSVRSRTKNKRK